MDRGEGTDPERCRAMTVSRPAHKDRTVGSHRVIKSSGNTSGMPPTRVLTTLANKTHTMWDASSPNNILSAKTNKFAGLFTSDHTLLLPWTAQKNTRQGRFALLQQVSTGLWPTLLLLFHSHSKTHHFYNSTSFVINCEKKKRLFSLGIESNTQREGEGWGKGERRKQQGDSKYYPMSRSVLHKYRKIPDNTG